MEIKARAMKDKGHFVVVKKKTGVSGNRAVLKSGLSGPGRGRILLFVQDVS